MGKKIVLLVCAAANRRDLENAIALPLDGDRIRHEIVWRQNYAQALNHVDGTGFPDLIVTEMNTGNVEGGLDLLCHVRIVGRSVPVVIWSIGFSEYTASRISTYSGIALSCGQPDALATLGRYAVTLLHGQRRAP